MNKFYVTGFLLILVTIFCASCTNTKKFVYFNDLRNGIDTGVGNQIPALLVQHGDILQITISTIDKEVSATYNPIATINNNAVAQGTIIAQGYLVDQDGNIELPMIGKIMVKGKTTSAINELVKTEVNKSIKNAFVSTRFLNFRIAVMGDVAKPGSYTIANERVSILDALSLAGDLNITAERTDILLIRETEGQKKYVSINLNDSKTLSSPYYYLSNNDVLYVKPGKNRVVSSTLGFQLLPTMLGALSLITVILTNVIK